MPICGRTPGKTVQDFAGTACRENRRNHPFTLDRHLDRAVKRSLSFYITKLARLGGYLVRSGDPLPGYRVMWRGLSRLADIELGINAAKLVGS
jgi:hypothetical protein